MTMPECVERAAETFITLALKARRAAGAVS
jgi:hypothetical protein